MYFSRILTLLLESARLLLQELEINCRFISMATINNLFYSFAINIILIIHNFLQIFFFKISVLDGVLDFSSTSEKPFSHNNVMSNELRKIVNV